MDGKKIDRPKGYDGKMEAMAARLGLSVVADHQRLGLTEADVQRLMRRCTACYEPADCASFLVKAAPDDPVPRYCANRVLLLHLQDKARDAKT